MAPPSQPAATGQGSVSGAIKGKTPAAGQTGQAGAGEQAGEQAAQPEVNAKVTGTVTDLAGRPLANVTVTSFYGVSTTTDAQGKYTLDVVADDEMVLDFTADGFISRQLMTGVPKDADVEIDATLKPLDSNAVKLSATEGGTINSADGNSQLIIPPGALAGDTTVRVNWLDPMPSDQFSEAYGQLPGPLLTREKDGPPASISPLGFSQIDFDGLGLAPGAQATLRMKVNPEALKLAEATGQEIDFNNPASLQQPCYEYDREISAWVNPATSKLEKDANGDVWFVYTVHGREAPKNFSILQSVSRGSHVTGQRTIWDRRTRTRVTGYSVVVGGGGRRTFSSMDELRNWCRRNWCDMNSVNTLRRTETYYVPRIENIFGKNLSGNVKERSSNSGLNGRPISGAAVFHRSDYFGGTTKYTGGNGGFTIPVSHRVNNLSVYRASWQGANSTGGGYNLTIPTDGSLRYNVVGGTANYNASNSNLRGGGLSGAGSLTASRDTTVSVGPRAGTYLIKSGQRNPNIGGRVPVNGVLNLGEIHVLKDVAGRVVEESLNRNLNGKGLAGATVNHGADYNRKTTKSTGGDGSFSIPMFSNASVDVSGATWNNARSSGGGYQLKIKTDGSVKANVVGGAASMSAANSNLSGESWSGAVNKPASRDSQVTLTAPQGGFLFTTGRQGSLTKTVPVVGVADFGTVKVCKDFAGKVIERVAGNDNYAHPNKATDGAGLAGVNITGFTDATNGSTGTSTDANGNYGFSLYFSQSAPTVNANFANFVNRDGSGDIELPTDSSFTVTLSGHGSQGETLTVVYYVDNIKHTKQVAPSDNTISFSFARDTSDNRLNFRIESISGTTVVSTGTMPTGTLTPNGSGQGEVRMAFKSDGAK